MSYTSLSPTNTQTLSIIMSVKIKMIIKMIKWITKMNNNYQMLYGSSLGLCCYANTFILVLFFSWDASYCSFRLNWHHVLLHYLIQRLNLQEMHCSDICLANSYMQYINMMFFFWHWISVSHGSTCGSFVPYFDNFILHFLDE